MTKTLLLLTIVAGVLCLESASDSADQVQTIKATVVAYDLGVEQADGSCNQTAIARSEKSARRNESDRYFIIRHQSSCPKLIPEERFKIDRKRSFKLRRDTKCDQSLEDLKYFVALSPTGTRSESPRLKTVRSWDEIQVAAHQKLPCYILTSSEPFER
jgi:hypothetical protein